MAENVYVGLVVSSQTTATLTTATIDNVALTVGTTPFITGVSPSLGAIGTVVAVTGSSFGATQGTSTLSFNDSFGNLVASTGTLVNNFRYTGREFDTETSLYYYRARYYDSTAGRFGSEDPLQFRAGSPNFYAYVENGPINRIDSLGLDWLNNLADFSTGAGSILSFGLTDVINDATGASSVVSKCSLSHKLGGATGIGLSIAIGGAAGAEAAEANAGRDGSEFSHFIPNRMGGPRSVFNGNYVTQELHYLTDNFRHPSGWQNWGPKLPPVAQQVLRIPWVYGGAGAGAAYGGASAAGGSCGCN
jgi:RHS repeat-associated protein